MIKFGKVSMAKNLFELLENHDDFECQEGKQQIMIFFQGKKVGGYNTKSRHWYLSKMFVANKVSDAGLLSYGFKMKEIKKSSHMYWEVKGLTAEKNFKNALRHMTSAEL